MARQTNHGRVKQSRNGRYGYQLRGQELEPIEQQIMLFLSLGLDNIQIAARLGTNPNTIANRLSMIRSKLECSTTIQAMHVWTMEQPRFYRRQG